MYYCQECGKLSDPGESQTKIVVEEKKVSHYQEINGKEVETGKGEQIVRELIICSDCASKRGISVEKKLRIRDIDHE